MPFFWRHPLALAPLALRPWLCERGSLTARVQRHFPAFKLQRLAQGWRSAHHDEQAFFPHGRNACREVLLMSGTTPLIYAHSVTSRQSLKRGFRLFARAGRRPLGALLFADPTIRRSPLGWCCLDARHPLWREANAASPGQPPRLWARRSLFHAGQDSLLVTEVFLAPAFTKRIS